MGRHPLPRIGRNASLPAAWVRIVSELVVAPGSRPPAYTAEAAVLGPFGTGRRLRVNSTVRHQMVCWEERSILSQVPTVWAGASTSALHSRLQKPRAWSWGPHPPPATSTGSSHRAPSERTNGRGTPGVQHRLSPLPGPAPARRMVSRLILKPAPATHPRVGRVVSPQFSAIILPRGRRAPSDLFPAEEHHQDSSVSR